MNEAEPTPPSQATRRVLRVVVGVVLGFTVAMAVNAREPNATVAVPLPSSTTGAPGTTAATTSTAATTVPVTTTTRVPVTTTTTTVPPTTTTTSTTTTTEPAPAVVAGAPATAPTTTVPQWPPYTPLPALDGVAALTGEPADASITGRPILAVKIENSSGGRPQWGLEQADAMFEENVEGTTRFVALYQTRLPDRLGPVRSARTGDLDVLAAMNRPVLAWSGGNAGVTKWIDSAASSGVLVNFTAQRHPCYERSSAKRAPHNLLVDPLCAIFTAAAPGPARPLWDIDADWELPDGVFAQPDTTFTVKMDGVTIEWTWDPVSQTYLRAQAGGPHVTMSGAQLAADTVVELRAVHAPSVVDARTPHPVTTGGNFAVVHRDGMAIQARWERPTPYDRFSFTDVLTGQPIPLDTGTTLVEVMRVF